MIIGIPREIKDQENRVAITPAGVLALTAEGHRVVIEKGAGVGSGITDAAYGEAGAILRSTAQEIYEEAEMILKVKEPQPAEYDLFKPGQILFTYLHLAAEPELTAVLCRQKVVAIAYETIQLADGSLPLLMPMSEVAGRMAVQLGARFLEKTYGGRGVLLAGVPGVPPANVVIIGGGTVGTNAARIAVGMGAQVTVLDNNPRRLAYLDELFNGRVQTIMSNSYNLARAVVYADLLIGAVLIPGARAPHLVTEDMVKKMKPGSVIIDVAVDQGGCIATIDRVTTHSDPVYIKHGVIHYAVANIPGIVARTSTFALTNATLPYVLKLAKEGFRAAAIRDPALAKGINVLEEKITCPAVAQALQLPYTPLEGILC
ncbi:Alanine dehydrogenase [Neomoorella glycerini]|uniref:Alanine dehydrogenase n=1 Tax=Neomoorella glycerini TaxID=55779 RepID=A0A6I5ZNL0_9FIRM|nr:alanine dehydrogenase [Moorella glycerini]QGP91219.1 Alanine dehydrogenase [Moorella glycerini]